MFYNDFILVFIEKYPQKYPLFFLLPPKKPSFADNHNKITARLPTHRIYYLLRQQRFICWQNLYIFVRFVHFAASRLPQGYPKVLSESLRQVLKVVTTSRLGEITSRFSQGFINPKCVFWGYKKMTKARSWPVFAQTFDTPLLSGIGLIILTNHKKGCFEF